MKRFALLVSLVVAACGDNGIKPDAFVTPPRDGDIGDGSNGPGGPSTAVVVAGDFTTGDPGVLATVDDKNLVAHTVSAAFADADPVMRKIGDELFIINRSANNVTVLDAHTFALKAQLSTGDGSNPQDAAPVGTKIYVPVFAGKGVAVLTRGTTDITTIDFSADDPVDNKPDCNSAIAVGTNVFVSCEVLIGNGATGVRGPGKIHVIDTTDDSVTATFDMQNLNPFGLFEQLNDGTIAIPTIVFATGAGCIEQIGTTGTFASKGCIVQNADLGNYASRFDVDPDGQTLWVVTPAPDFSTSHLEKVGISTGDVGPALEASGTAAADVAVCPDGNIAVSDTTFSADGIRFYNKDGTEVTDTAVNVGLPPFSSHGLICQ